VTVIFIVTHNDMLHVTLLHIAVLHSIILRMTVLSVNRIFYAIKNDGESLSLLPL
jgi:hypothetical protein